MAKKILVLVAAIMAFGVVPAVASATNSPELVETGGKTVEVGKKILATNVGNTLMTDGSTNTLLSCQTATMTGTVTKNDGSNVEGNIADATFKNHETSTCSGILGATTVTSTPATNGVPWCIRSTSTMATDEFQVRGNECSKAQRPIRFILDLPFGVVCTYQRTNAITGTFTTGEGKTVMSISHVEFPLLESVGFGCPSAGYLDMSFTLETDESPFARVDII
ncbi:MAG TPA: hypothetical protein VF125_03175 [Solirubrobacterales bacterium]